MFENVWVSSNKVGRNSDEINSELVGLVLNSNSKCGSTVERKSDEISPEMVGLVQYYTVGDSQTKLVDPTPGQQSDESRTVRNWIEICLTPV